MIDYLAPPSFISNKSCMGLGFLSHKKYFELLCVENRGIDSVQRIRYGMIVRVCMYVCVCVRERERDRDTRCMTQRIRKLVY